MNKKNISFGVLAIVLYSCAYAMDPKPTQYLLQPEQYADFRFTRPYGTLKLGCLPHDVTEKHMRQSLSQLVVTEFKHKLIQYKFQEKLFTTIPLEAKTKKPFQYHDGTYTIVPDVADYVMWDCCNPDLYTTTINGEHYDKLLGSCELQSPTIYCHFLRQNRDDQSKKIFYALRKDKEDNDKKIISSFNFNVTHQLYSYDFNWLALSYESTFRIFKTRGMDYDEWHFDTPITALCAAHQVSYFGVCIGNKIGLITPEKYVVVSMETVAGPLTSVQFSPNDEYMFAHDEHSLILYDTNVLAASGANGQQLKCDALIQKASFSPDSKTIFVAFKDGTFGLYSAAEGLSCINTAAYLFFWRILSNTDLGPIILWSNTYKLLFLLDPTTHINPKNWATFFVRKSTTGELLMCYNFFPNDNPLAMGLTHDERAIIFVDKNKNVSRLNLYDDQDVHAIDSITNTKADFFQLILLGRMIENNSMNVKEIVQAVRGELQ